MTARRRHRIDADVLIPGKGEPLKNGTVVFEDKLIVHVGPQDSLPQEFSSLPTTRVPVVMPGMWDCHVHYLGKPIGGVEIYQIPPALAAARSVPDLKVTLMAGFTSVREVGGHGCHLAVAIAEGRIPGPTIYSASSPISMTAGHADAHAAHIADVEHACANGAPFCLADGVDGCIKAVRLQLRSGAKLIKICASGGVASLRDNPHHQQFSHEEIKAIVDEAARAHLVVAAHCHGKAGIMAALHAGCKTIEHGSYLDDEGIDLMLEKDAMLVATRQVIEDGLRHQEMFWNSTSYQKLVDLGAAHQKAYSNAIKRGVKIALGTDKFTSSKDSDLGHGNNAHELIYAVAAGMTPLQAIEAATAMGPLTVGDQAPLSGQLKVGYDADVIALERNPLNDIEVFRDVANVTHVWQGGKLVKAPGLLV